MASCIYKLSIIAMQFKPCAHIKTKQFFLGSIQLKAGDNFLSSVQLSKLKTHPNYQYYIDLGILIPNKEEVKPTGKERAISKKTRTKKDKIVVHDSLDTDTDEVSDHEVQKS